MILLLDIVVLLCLLFTLINLVSCDEAGSGGEEPRRPNVIVILADDLGYGDLQVPPFLSPSKFDRIKTPHLKRMAHKSVILTNFHTAAPQCTPTRASILTGLLPWRLGISTVFGTGPAANGHLANLGYNLPRMLQNNGYYTAHVGKWHLGGMTKKDIAERRNKGVNCTAGPLQHGFSEYVSMAEGPDSARLNYLLPNGVLYSEGSRHLVRNDQEMPTSNVLLTNKQASEAIRIMKESTSKNKPFFINLWFDAPHGPYQKIRPFDSFYKGKKRRRLEYATMVSSMDAQIGLVRSEVKKLNQSTIILFLSDNGPEDGAGSSGGFRGRKRSLYEGGIRVPCFFEWQDHFKENYRNSELVVSTDLFPTILELAKIPIPVDLKIDGKSIINILEKNQISEHEGQGRKEDRIVKFYTEMKVNSSAVMYRGFKLFHDHTSNAWRMYDLRKDPTESNPIPLRSFPNFTEAIHTELLDFVANANKPHSLYDESCEQYENSLPSM